MDLRLLAESLRALTEEPAKAGERRKWKDGKTYEKQKDGSWRPLPRKAGGAASVPAKKPSQAKPAAPGKPAAAKPAPGKAQAVRKPAGKPQAPARKPVAKPGAAKKPAAPAAKPAGFMASLAKGFQSGEKAGLGGQKKPAGFGASAQKAFQGAKPKKVDRATAAKGAKRAQAVKKNPKLRAKVVQAAAKKIGPEKTKAAAEGLRALGKRTKPSPEQKGAIRSAAAHITRNIATVALLGTAVGAAGVALVAGKVLARVFSALGLAESVDPELAGLVFEDTDYGQMADAAGQAGSDGQALGALHDYLADQVSDELEQQGAEGDGGEGGAQEPTADMSQQIAGFGQPPAQMQQPGQQPVKKLKPGQRGYNPVIDY